MWQVVLCFVDIGGILDSKCVNFLFLLNNWQKFGCDFLIRWKSSLRLLDAFLPYPLYFNSIFHNVCLIYWRIVLALRKRRLPWENHRPVRSHSQRLSSTPRHELTSSAMIVINYIGKHAKPATKRFPSSCWPHCLVSWVITNRLCFDQTMSSVVIE